MGGAPVAMVELELMPLLLIGCNLVFSVSGDGLVENNQANSDGKDGVTNERRRRFMRMVRTIIVSLAVLSAAAMAKADSQVWYTAANVNGDGTGGPSGGAGQPLNLVCGAPAACSWVITMHIGYGANGPVGFSTDLATTEAGLSVNPVTPVGSQAGAPNPNNPWSGANSIYQPGTGGSLAALLVGTQGQASSGAVSGPGAATPVIFTLNLAAGTTQGIKAINAKSVLGNGVAWVNSSFDGYEIVQYGNNIAGPADPDGSQPANAVISISNVPEPATLSLLAVGTLLALRRRRNA